MKSIFPIALTLLSLASGCGKGLSVVSGTVTLDDKPLKGAYVEFSPISGRPSIGKTDGDGHYQLEYSTSKSGVEPGQHTVRIGTYEEASVDMKTGEPTDEVEEIVPVKYNRETTLTADVKPGKNEIDFDLELDKPQEENLP
ncbi:MAG: carboxypeptidase regulatory-like domain-containing protein [Pirellulaceae bacterium]|jgi:hypothetical protein|nr:carboxypeptidase regulatory-like domain-containing protein [Pirellulaceae bacterium]